MNRKLLIRIDSEKEMEKVFKYLYSINELIPHMVQHNDWKWRNLNSDIEKYYKILFIGFREDENEWDWDSVTFWDRCEDRVKITCQQLFREQKLERIANE